MEAARFADFAARKQRRAAEASFWPLVTEEERRQLTVLAIGNDWTHNLFDGPFYLSPLPEGLPAVSLVFVQSRDGNTDADDPEELGGGPLDAHLIYEGLSRVAADAVLAGAKTAGPGVFFSVWHPELVALRETFAVPRHPAQVLLTGSACIDVESLLSCNVPEVPVYVLTTPEHCELLKDAAARRPWMTVIAAPGLADHLRILRDRHGISRISCVGGRTTATSLLDAGLVQDVYLTTTAKAAGAPGTPFYSGEKPPVLDVVVRKQGTDAAFPIRFEHFVVRNSSR